MKKILIVSAALFALLVAGVAVAQTVLGVSTNNEFQGTATTTSTAAVTIGAPVPIYSGYCGTITVTAVGRLASGATQGEAITAVTACCNSGGTVSCANEPSLTAVVPVGTEVGSISFAAGGTGVLVQASSASAETVSWNVRGRVLYQ